MQSREGGYGLRASTPGVPDFKPPAPPTLPPPPASAAWGPDLPGVISLSGGHTGLLSPRPYSPGSFHHHGACAFKLSKTGANENKENDLLAVIYIVNLLWSDFFPS